MKLIKQLTYSAVFGAALLASFSVDAKTIKMRASDTHPEGYPTVVAIQSMGAKLEKDTGGEIKMQMFPGGVLGSEKEVLEQVQFGAIQIARISLGVVGPVVPEVNVFNLPFVFRDEAHMREVTDGEIGQELLDKVTASSAGIVALGWMDGGSRSVYTNKPIEQPADLKGYKFRMMGNPIFVDTMNAMGGNGISMAYGEVFTALQTGVIDGAENNPPSLYTSNHYTTDAKHYSLTRHLIIPEIFVMSKKTWNKLTPEQQAMVKQYSREATAEQRVLWDKSVADYNEKLKAAGVQYHDVNYQAFYNATEVVRQKYGSDFSDLLARIKAVN